MKKIFRFMLLALLGCLSVTAFAKEKSIEIKPDRAYLLVQVDPIEYQMLGTNRMKMDVGFARYDVARNDIRGGFKSSENPVPEGESVRTLARKKPIAKDGKRRLYLLEVEPDTWVIESVGVSSGGALGVGSTSFSLGSYHFEAKAGQITDLGVFVPGRELSGNPDEKVTAGKVFGMALLGPFGGPKIEPVPLVLKIRERKADDLQLPVAMQKHEITYPAFVYGSSFGNYGGGLVNRIDGREGRTRATGETVYASMPGALKNEMAETTEVSGTVEGASISTPASSSVTKRAGDHDNEESGSDEVVADDEPVSITEPVI
jgi:hypothetical protein